MSKIEDLVIFKNEKELSETEKSIAQWISLMKK